MALKMRRIAGSHKWFWLLSAFSGGFGRKNLSCPGHSIPESRNRLAAFT